MTFEEESLTKNSSIDTCYCGGFPDDLTLNHDIEFKMKFQIQNQNPWTSKDETVSFAVKDWMEGLKGTGNENLKEANGLLKAHAKKNKKDNGPLDLLSFYDKWIDGQIGEFGSVQEHVYQNNKLLALFGFRDISGTTHDKFKQGNELLSPLTRAMQETQVVMLTTFPKYSLVKPGLTNTSKTHFPTSSRAMKYPIAGLSSTPALILVRPSPLPSVKVLGRTVVYCSIPRSSTGLDISFRMSVSMAFLSSCGTLSIQ